MMTLLLAKAAIEFTPGPFWIGLVVGVGMLSIYALLPRPKPAPVWVGSLLAAIALLLAGFGLVRTMGLSPEMVLFVAFSAVAIIFAGLMITQRNPVRAALAFAMVVLSTCGLFLLQAAPFLMAATTIVYAGAIIVTFVFVIMLAQQHGASDADARSREPMMSCITGFLLLGCLIYVLQGNLVQDGRGNDLAPTNVASMSPFGKLASKPREPGTGRDMPAQNVAYLGQVLFTDYLLAVELGGTLLLVATIGAIAITMKRTGESA